MGFWWGFIIGLFVGANVGIIVFAMFFNNWKCRRHE